MIHNLTALFQKKQIVLFVKIEAVKLGTDSCAHQEQLAPYTYKHAEHSTTGLMDGSADSAIAIRNPPKCSDNKTRAS